MGGKSTRSTALLLAAIVGAACVLLSAAPAAAHNSLTSSDPKDGARLDRAPARVTLTFLAKLDPRATKITVTGPDNVSAASAEPAFSGARVEVGFRPGAAGLYTVGYELPSSDGHPIKGRIRFTLTVGASPTTAASPAAPASASAPAVPTSALSSPDPGFTSLAGTGRDEDGGSTWWPWVVGAAVLLAALVGGGLLHRRRTRVG